MGGGDEMGGGAGEAIVPYTPHRSTQPPPPTPPPTPENGYDNTPIIPVKVEGIGNTIIPANTRAHKRKRDDDNEISDIHKRQKTTENEVRVGEKRKRDYESPKREKKKINRKLDLDPKFEIGIDPNLKKYIK